MTRSARVAINRLSLCLVLFFVINLHGQDSSKSAPDYSKEAFVIQRILNKLKFENDGTFALETAIQVRVQSAAGVQGWGLIQLPYASNEGDAAITSVKVTKPDGKVVATPLENNKDTAAPLTA